MNKLRKKSGKQSFLQASKYPRNKLNEGSERSLQWKLQITGERNW
jgi:hypothetical protein